MKKLLALIAIVVLTGCSSTSHIGTIGSVEFHEVTSRGVFSESHSMVVIHDLSNGKVQPASVATGPGIFDDFIGAAGGAAQAYLWGSSYNPDPGNYNSTNNETIEVEGSSQSQVQNQNQSSKSHSKSEAKSKSSASAHDKNSNLNLNSNLNSNKNSNKISAKNHNKNVNQGGGGVRQNGGGRGGNNINN